MDDRRRRMGWTEDIPPNADLPRWWEERGLHENAPKTKTYFITRMLIENQQTRNDMKRRIPHDPVQALLQTRGWFTHCRPPPPPVLSPVPNSVLLPHTPTPLAARAPHPRLFADHLLPLLPCPFQHHLL